MNDSILAALPDVHFTDREPAVIEAQVLSLYQILAGRYLAPADPVRIFLLALVAVIVQQRAVIDATARGELLAYATGDVLDHLAAFFNVSRKAATAASTTVRFSITSSCYCICLFLGFTLLINQVVDYLNHFAVIALHDIFTIHHHRRYACQLVLTRQLFGL